MVPPTLEDTIDTVSNLLFLPRAAGKMSVSKPQMGLTTDKWLWLAGTAKIVHRHIQPFNAFIDRNYHQQHMRPNLGIVESHTILSTFQMKKAGYVATIGYVLQGSVLNATCFPISNREITAP